MSIINLAPILQPAIQTAALILTGVAAWAVNKLAGHFHLLQQATMQQAILKALDNGIAFAEASAEKSAAGASVDVKSALAATAADYVVSHFPAYIAKLGVTPESLAQTALAKLPK